MKRPTVKGVLNGLYKGAVTSFALVGLAASGTVVYMGVHGDLRAMVDDWAKVQMSQNHCPGLHTGPSNPVVIGNPIFKINF